MSCLLFYCQTLPLSYTEKARNCDNNIIRTHAVINIISKWNPGLLCQNILFLPLTLLSVTSNVAYGNTLLTWHTTVEKYSSARICEFTFSVYSVLLFYIVNL